MATRRIVMVSLPPGIEAELHWGRALTPVGQATVAWSPAGIHNLAVGALQEGFEPGGAASRDDRGAQALMARVFAPGDDGPFRVCIDGTAFQRCVWRALCSIPAGRPLSYGQLAASIGRPGAARGVGSACGANPVAVLIPCHRVIAGDGNLGGYSGGVEAKRRLLAWEGWEPPQARS